MLKKINIFKFCLNCKIYCIYTLKFGNVNMLLFIFNVNNYHNTPIWIQFYNSLII